MERKRKGLGRIIAAVCLAVFLAAGLYNAPQVTRYTVTDASIPQSFQNYAVCLVADTHFMDTKDSSAEIVSLVRGQAPNLIILAGDIYDIKANINSAPNFVKELTAIAPVFSVTGNHERWHLRYKALLAYYEELGVVNLENNKMSLTKEGQSISFFGVTDPGDNLDLSRIFMEDQIARLDRKYGVDAGSYNIMLFHRANLLDEFADEDFDLILAGHMHGGQVRFPLIGSVISQYGEWFPKYTTGMVPIGENTAVITRGLGNTKLVPRFYNRPEVVVIRLDGGG